MGRLTTFDVVIRHYYDASDHYDPDHYDYYVPYMGSFLTGGRRFAPDEVWNFRDEEILAQDDRPLSIIKDRVFDRFKKALSGHDGFKLVRAQNACLEVFGLVSDKYDLSSIVEKHGLSLRNSFHSELVFSVDDENKFYEFATLLPQRMEVCMSVFKKRLYLPSDEGRRSRMIDDDMFFIQIAAHDYCFSSIKAVREAFNTYFLDAIENIEKTRSKRTLQPFLGP